MKTILIKEGCPNPVNLGEKGENGVSQIQFDYSEWISDFGEGAISLLVKRKGDTAAYPVVLTTADGIATWTISDIDTAVQGYGKAEYVFTIDDKIAKSAVFSFFVASDLGEGGDVPDPYESWIDTLTALGGETLINAQRAEAAESGAETAQTAAETAKDLAISAAEDAQHSETQAELSASAAAESAESASGSAAQAQQSATNAATSATQSANNLAEAIEAAEDAEAAEEAATAAAQSAQESANIASNSATIASGAATTASNAATNAAASATSASGSASAAATSAGQAAESAEKADIDLLKLLPTDSASGSIASFPDGADGVPVEALTVALEPIQSGSGTPSPDNVRPITGHTQAQVWRAGKNLLDLSILRQGGFDGTTGVNNVSFDEYLPIQGGVTYAWSTALTTISGRYLRFYDADKQLLSNVSLYDGGTKTFTTPSNAAYYRAMWYRSGGITPSDITADQIQVGTTATTYEPPSIVNITIPLSQTVYGGTLDVVGGKCVVDRAMIDLGSLGYNLVTASGVPMFYAGLSDGVRDDDFYGICTCYKTVTTQSAFLASDKSIRLYGSAQYDFSRVGIRDSSYTDSTTLKAALSGQYLCYELATPIEIQLSDIPTISTLLGQNNVWSDSGDVDVTYRADIQKYIAKVIAEALA